MAKVVTGLAIEILPVAGRIGAEIVGVHLGAGLSAAALGAIRQALLRHRVVFFRRQDHLDDREQEAFGRRFGSIVAHPTVPPLAGTETVLELDAAKGGGRANHWHTDVTFLAAYPKASILRAVVVPAYGGDTVWANTAAAYRDLPADLRTLADRLWALHTNAYDYAALRPNATPADLRRFNEVFTATIYETEHPVVRIHPESGERTLVIGGFLQKLIGYSESDSAHLVSLLHSHALRLENTVRWRWRAGDVAIWDNQATLHYAIDDYGDQPRVMRRVTVAGEAPVSVDGRRSVTRQRPRAAA
jgi:alpha-ketoglutarate-dependent sulfate ester dioxygenase